MKTSYYNNARLDVIEFLPKKNFQKILEIGGGEFETLNIISRQNNAEAWGVDLNQNQNKKIKFIKGSIENQEICALIPDIYFDLILANDVIEHLQNTEEFFNKISTKLITGGLLVISVPNIRQIRGLYHIYFRGTFPREDAGLFDKTHLRWFCKEDIIYLTKNKFQLKLVDHKSVGRLVPNLISHSILGELLGLQNLFIFEKI